MAEMGLCTKEIVVSPDQSTIRKLVDTLYEPDGRVIYEPDEHDYLRIVNGSLGFLTEEQWGISQYIPKCRVELKKSPRFASGYECWW